MEPVLLEVNSFLGRLAVKFERTDGRFSHSIEVLGDDCRVTALKSVEDPSLANLPCFTDLHAQNKTLFLTGANGPCHWSMSVQIGELCRPADPGETGNHSRAQFAFFDVACRLKEQILDLGSEYARLEGLTNSVESMAHAGVALSAANPPARFGMNPSVEKATAQTIKFEPQPQCTITYDGYSTVRFSALDASIEKFPATVQWSYAIWM